MPSTKHTQRRKSDQKTAKPFSMKKALVISTISVTAFLLVVPAVAIWLPDKLAAGGEKAAMVKYLNEKYGKEFVVKNYRVEGSGFGIEGDPAADAWPKDDMSLKFSVWDRGNFHKGEHAYSDRYLGTLWAKEEGREVEDYLSTNGIEYDSYAIDIQTGAVGRINTVTGRVLSFSEAIIGYSDDITYRLSVKSTSTLKAAEPSPHSLGAALSVIDFVKGKNISNSQAYYLYRDARYRRRDTDGSPLYQYRIDASGAELRGVQSENELIKFFTKIN